MFPHSSHSSPIITTIFTGYLLCSMLRAVRFPYEVSHSQGQVSSQQMTKFRLRQDKLLASRQGGDLRTEFELRFVWFYSDLSIKACHLTYRVQWLSPLLAL